MPRDTFTICVICSGLFGPRASTAKWPVGTRPTALRSGFGWVVRSHDVTYRAAAMAGDELTIRTWVSDIARFASRRKYVICRPVDQAILARVETRWVYVDLTRAPSGRHSRSCRFPDRGVRSRPRSSLGVEPWRTVMASQRVPNERQACCPDRVSPPGRWRQLAGVCGGGHAREVDD